MSIWITYPHIQKYSLVLIPQKPETHAYYVRSCTVFSTGTAIRKRLPTQWLQLGFFDDIVTDLGHHSHGNISKNNISLCLLVGT